MLPRSESVLLSASSLWFHSERLPCTNKVKLWSAGQNLGHFVAVFESHY